MFKTNMNLQLTQFLPPPKSNPSNASSKRQKDIAEKVGLTRAGVASVIANGVEKQHVPAVNSISATDELEALRRTQEIAQGAEIAHVPAVTLAGKEEISHVPAVNSVSATDDPPNLGNQTGSGGHKSTETGLAPGITSSYLTVTIEKYGFEEGTDFIVCFPNLGSKTGSGEHNARGRLRDSFSRNWEKPRFNR